MAAKPREAAKPQESGRWWRYVAPGIVSGASENDPTTVASLAVIGASTLYALGWLLVLIAPMLAVVQGVAAHVATVRKNDLQSIVRKFYGMPAAFLLLIPLLAVNLFTLVADLEGGSAALSLLTTVDGRWFAVPLAALVAFLLVRGNYNGVRTILAYVPLVFLAYAIAAFLAHPDWRAVAAGSLIPHLRFNKEETSGAIAMLGTTLTAYAYVWGSIEVSEERPPVAQLKLVELQSSLGTIVAVASFWFILVATGATLGVHHRPVETAQDAAQALVPFAGRYASVLFAVGLLASALLAIPVITATSAYAIGALFGWNTQLDAKFLQAPRFYAFVIVMLAICAVCASFGLNPIRLLFVSSIAGGLATPISLAILMTVAGSRKAMGRRTAPLWLLACGWIVTAVVTAAAAAFVATSV